MDLDDFFEHDRHDKRRRRSHDIHESRGRDRDRDHSNRSGSSHHHDDDSWNRGRHGHDHHCDDLFDVEYLARRVLANKRLLILASVAVVVLVVLAAVFLLPLLGQAFGYVNKSGLKGVIDGVWQGNAK